MLRRVGAIALSVGLGALACVPHHADAYEVDNHRLFELGRRLFHEPAASLTGDAACGGCHDPRHAYSDPRPVSQAGGRRTKRHSQTLLDLGQHTMHWDGEFETLRHLIATRVAAPRDRNELVSARLSANYRGPFAPFAPDTARSAATEFTYADSDAGSPIRLVGAAERLRADGRYARGFELTFGDPEITIDRVVTALEIFTGGLRSGTSPFDRFVRGDGRALGLDARRGLRLYMGPAGCATCHPLDEGRAITDGAFHDAGIGGRTAAERPRIKTPNLRDVARRGRFMHDGSMDSLEDVVDRYVMGGRPDDELRPLSLTKDDRADLVAFLRALSAHSGHVPPQTAVDAKRTTAIRLVNVDGSPAVGVLVGALPHGDPLSASAFVTKKPTALTDDAGWTHVDLPKTSHFRLSSPDAEIGIDRPHPDWLTDATFVVTPRASVSVVADWSPLDKEPDGLVVRITSRGRTLAKRLDLVRRMDVGQSLYAMNVTLDAAYQINALSAEVDGYLVRLESHHLDLSGGASAPIVLRSRR